MTENGLFFFGPSIYVYHMLKVNDVLQTEFTSNVHHQIYNLGAVEDTDDRLDLRSEVKVMMLISNMVKHYSFYPVQPFQSTVCYRRPVLSLF